MLCVRTLRVPAKHVLASTNAVASFGEDGTMSKSLTGIVYAIGLIVIIVGMDLAFFRGNTAGRLVANVAVAAAAAGVYFAIFRHAR